MNDERRHETDYVSVTEIAGDDVSREQLQRFCDRYYWAGGFCDGKDVLEVACGSGQGLGYLAGIAKSLEAGDYSEKVLSIARAHYGQRVPLMQFDAQDMPFLEHSKDIVILFEAIYYLPEAEKFVQECKRILRPEGKVLIVTDNKDLYDFNPSPYMHRYYGVVELEYLFARYGFVCKFFGGTPYDELQLHRRILRPLKKLAVVFGLIPKTMKGKKMLKRLVFGKLVRMPAEIKTNDMIRCSQAQSIPAGIPDRRHKVILCAASLAPGEQGNVK